MSDLRDELIEFALTGRGWHAILRRLGDATGTEVRLIGVHGTVLAASSPGVDASISPSSLLSLDEPTMITLDDGWRGIAIRVVAGNRRVGYLAGAAADPNDELAALLADATTAISIEAARRDAEAHARAETAERVVDEIRFGVLRDRDEVLRTAGRFGVALDQPHWAVAFGYRGANIDSWRTALSWIEAPVKVQGPVGWTVLSPDTGEVERIRIRLQGIVGDSSPVLAGCGSRVDDVDDTRRSFAEAASALAILEEQAPTLGPTTGAILTFESLGLVGLLVDAPAGRVARYVDSRLGPIADRPELLATLAAWFDENASRAAVAERLHLHRNTVGTRLDTAAGLLGVDLADASQRLDIHAALTARSLLGALERIDALTLGEPVNPR